MDEEIESLEEFVALARQLPRAILGGTARTVIDLTGASPRRVRRLVNVVIPDRCQEFVAGLASYGD
ncbi:MAG: hypothetical protein ACYDAQ_21805 [Mycobacteriales bacterium]